MKQRNTYKKLGIKFILLSISIFILFVILSALDFQGTITMPYTLVNGSGVAIIAVGLQLVFYLGVILLVIGVFKGDKGTNSTGNFIKNYYIDKYNRRKGFYKHIAGMNNNTAMSNDDRGKEGEKNIINELDHLDRSKSKALHNITIKAPNGDTPQIDHIVVGENGIYHIETKAYQGHIQIDPYGSWIRTIDGNTFGEESPLSQVQKHERALISLLGDKYPIISIVAIADKRTIVQGKENFPYPILTLGTIQNYIENTNTREIKLSYKEREIIMQTITNSLIPNKQF